MMFSLVGLREAVKKYPNGNFPKEHHENAGCVAIRLKVSIEERKVDLKRYTSKYNESIRLLKQLGVNIG